VQRRQTQRRRAAELQRHRHTEVQRTDAEVTQDKYFLLSYFCIHCSLFTYQLTGWQQGGKRRQKGACAASMRGEVIVPRSQKLSVRNATMLVVNCKGTLSLCITGHASILVSVLCHSTAADV
jgi:hypothetical protein